ncbi:protein-disulfide reductase DsbD domain-containing protein [Jannaschia sp. LMIT008]|uniref:protein-disulfide reductase DsbD domain-containing protein n=1 Tax=Jannaschia maritima TaxID=3032585 RepID=UPI002811A033|nr:protein-disulfide reductase DsbD domain-containing protein [Jannaschia sp. LMIT008]
MHSTPFLAVVIALIVALSSGGPGVAQSDKALGTLVQVGVIAGGRGSDGRHYAGLSFQLAAGWKTYWRSAGSLGISPRLDWRGSENLSRVDPVWPAPRVFAQGAGQSIGYDRDFVLPLAIAVRDPARPVRLDGSIDIGVCAEICVPVRFRVRADLPVRSGIPGPVRQALARRTPVSDRTATCVLRPDGKAMSVTVQLPALPLSDIRAVAIEAGDPSLWIEDATLTRDAGRIVARADAMARRGPVAIARGDLRITAIGTDGAIELAGCVGG